MLKYLGKRMLSVASVLVILSIFVFALVHMTPGEPARNILGNEASEEQVKELRDQLGLNEPIATQYVNWAIKALHGDLGESYYSSMTVVQSIREHLGPSLILSFWAQLLAVLIGVPAGILAAKRKGEKIDTALTGVATLGLSLPSFLLSLFLIMVFGVSLKLLPPSGYVELGQNVGEHFLHLIMPVVALGCMQAALITRMTRSSMIEVLSTDYIKTARAKGLREGTVLWKHALKNALNPILTVVGQSIGTLISGVAVVETVFNIPGIGQLIVSAILKRDYALIQGVVLVVSLIYVIINFVVDMLYGVVDPRIRLTGASK